ncbi:hypothetical protein ACVWY2_007666 [Bradyrhizobium sp. JR6.1]
MAATTTERKSNQSRIKNKAPENFSGAFFFSPSPRCCGERVGVRGGCSEAGERSSAETPPHPDCISDVIRLLPAGGEKWWSYVRVRIRIMKLSNDSSATCIQASDSLR